MLISLFENVVFQAESNLTSLVIDMSPRTYREAPVDVGHLNVQVEAEDQEEDSCHHKGTAADKLKEVDASTGRTHHDGLYADEANE